MVAIAPTTLRREELPSVLVVDDDLEICLLLKRYLGTQGLIVSTVSTVQEMFSTLESNPTDLVLLDLGLPDGDGLAVIRQMRLSWDIPVVILTGRDESVERILGLELGADDYVTKPFDLRELLARIRTVLRRTQSTSKHPASTTDILHFECFSLNVVRRELSDAAGQLVPLTAGEFTLLLALLHNARSVCSRDHLMNALHGRESGPFDRAIDVQISRLRRKLGTQKAPSALIKSIRGAGYTLTVDVTSGLNVQPD